MPQKIAIYARYSTENQNDRSIEDQFDVCKDYITKNSINGRVQFFSDRAISGSRRENRPDLEKMMRLVEDGKISVIVSESMSRLSRDMADMSNIHKMAHYKNVDISTAHEGLLNKMIIGITGTMNSMQIDQTKAQVCRGQGGNIKAGKIACGLAYGYSVRYLNDKGEPEGGLRDIKKAEADVIRRIYNEFINGSSVAAIRRKLNEDGIPAPRGGLWNTVTISGHNGRGGTGILQNPIYKGLLIWNRNPDRKHPMTGARQSIQNDPSKWVQKYEQSFQIIDTETWEKAQDMFAKRRRKNKAGKSYDHFPINFYCGHCSKPLLRHDAKNFICSQAKHYGICSKAKKISRVRLKTEIATILTETHRTIFADWIIDLKEITKTTEKTRKNFKNDIDRKQKRINAKVDSMMIALQNSPTVQNRIIEADDEIRKLTAEHDALPVFPDSNTFKYRPFSAFIKTSTPEAMLEIIDSATVSFDGEQLLITDIKPNWSELTQIIA